MKNMFFAMAIATLVLTSVGCKSLRTNQGAEQRPIAQVVGEKYVAQTELMNGGKAVTAELTAWEALGGLVAFGVPATYADRGTMGPAIGDHADIKQAITYIACKKAGCDSLLDVRYVFNETSYVIFGIKKVKCTIWGVPVKVVGYKKVVCPQAKDAPIKK